MKKIVFSFLLVLVFVKVQAQQDYKTILNSFYHHSQSDFKDIIDKQIDTTSIFYPCKLKPNIGEVKIGIFPNTTTLNWSIPLEESKEVQAVVKNFMKETYSNTKIYKTASDGTEDEGDITTNVYKLGTAKPLLIFQTVYYKNNEYPEKSQFIITIYGK